MIPDPAAPVGLPKDTTHFPGDDCDPPHLDMSTAAAPVGLDLAELRRLSTSISHFKRTPYAKYAKDVLALLDLMSRQEGVIEAARQCVIHEKGDTLWETEDWGHVIPHRVWFTFKKALDAFDESVRSLLPREAPEP